MKNRFVKFLLVCAALVMFLGVGFFVLPKENEVVVAEGANDTLVVSITSPSIIYTGAEPTISEITYSDTPGNFHVLINGTAHAIVLSVPDANPGDPILDDVDAMTASDLSGLFTIESKSKNAGSYNLTFSGSSPLFDNVEMEDGLKFLITRKGISLGAVTKEFDFTDEVTYSSITGVVSGDVVLAKYTFDSEVVGTHPVALDFNGADALNYQIISSPSNGTITKRMVTINVASTQLVYGDYSGSLAYTVFCEALGGNITTRAASYISGTVKLATATKYNVGTYSVTLSSLVSANFNFTLGTASVVINKRSLFSSGTFDKNYDGNNTVNIPEGKVTGVLALDDVGVSALYSGIIPGSWVVTFTLTGADGGNYSIANSSGTIWAINKTFNMDYLTEGNFVSDGESVSGSTIGSIVLSYPFSIIDGEYNAVLANSVTSAITAFPIPTRKGYTFEGWHYYDEESSTLKLVNNDGVNAEIFFELFASVDNITLYAVWDIKELELEIVSFTDGIQNSSGGTIKIGESNATSSEVRDYYSQETITVLVDKGYIFDGFYMNGVKLSSTYVHLFIENKVLEARFTSRTLTLQLDLYVGEYNNALFKEKVAAGFSNAGTLGYTVYPEYATRVFRSYENILNIPTLNMTGVTFSGWFHGETKLEVGDNIFTIAGEPQTGNPLFKLSARYEYIEYSVTLDPNGGTLVGSDSFDVTFLETIYPLEVPTLLGYEFDGWFDSSGKKLEVPASGAPWTISGAVNVTLTARWTAKQNTITVSVVGGGNISVNNHGNSKITWSLISGVYYVSAPTDSNFTITVADIAGYTVGIGNWAYAGGMLDIISAKVANFSGFYSSGSVTITPVPNLNRIRVQLDNDYGVLSVTGDITIVDDDEPNYILFDVLTGKTFTVSVTASIGYSVNTQFGFIVGSGSMNPAVIVDRTVSVEIYNFRSDSTIQVEIVPVRNTLTVMIPHSSVDRITSTGAQSAASVGVESYIFTAFTGMAVTIDIDLVFGYRFDYISYLFANDNGGSLSIFLDPINSNPVTQARLYISGFVTGGTITVFLALRDLTLNKETVIKDGNSYSISSEGGSVNAAGGWTVKYQSSVNATATANAPVHEFVGWFEDLNGTRLISTNATISYVVDAEDRTIYAIFKIREFSVNYVVYDNAGGTIQGETSQTVKYGQNTSSVTAVASRGYSFGYWSDAFPTALRTDLGVTDNLTITVYFEKEVLYVEVTTYERRNGVITKVDSSVTGEVYVQSPQDMSIKSSEIENVDFLIEGLTGGSLTLVVTPKPGYLFYGWRIVYSDYSNDLIFNSSYSPEIDGVVIVTTAFSNFYAGTGYKIEPIFVAKDNTITISFSTSRDDDVEGGLLSVKAAEGSVAGEVTIRSLNNYYKVTISALTRSAFEVTIYIMRGYSFNSISILGSGNFEVIQPYQALVSEDYIGSLRIIVKDYNMASSVVVNLIPDHYVVRFYNGEFLTAMGSVNFGELVSVASSSALTPYREGFIFVGWYNYEIGQGTRYLNEYGEPITKWNNTDFYDESGTEYVNLYAYFALLQTRTTISVIPSLGLTLYQVCTNSSDIWAVGGHLYFELGIPIHLKAPAVNGYKFNNWKFIYGDTSYDNYNETVTLSGIQELELQIIVEYYVEVNVSRNDRLGGTVLLVQEGKDGDFVKTTESVTLVATALDGYRFVGWRRLGTQLILSTSEEWTFLTTVPSTYEAVFVGLEVEVNLASGENISVSKLTVTGISGTFVYTGAELKNPITVRTGDTLVFVVSVNEGFHHDGWDNELVLNNTYMIRADDNGNSLEFTPLAKINEVIVTVVVNLDETNRLDDESPAGVLLNGSSFLRGSFVYDQMLNLVLTPKVGYKLVSVIISGDRLTSDFIAQVTSDGNFNIEAFIIYNNISYTEATITVTYKRILWVDYRVTFGGDGTLESPYLIGSAEKLAMLAYLISTNAEDGKYSTAVYMLTANINLDGKFWQPVGTEENPFSGRFDFMGFEISSVTLDAVYRYTLFDGVFGVVSNAEIIATKPNYLMIWLLTGFTAFVALMAIWIFAVSQRARVKEREELENSISEEAKIERKLYKDKRIKK